MDVAASLSSWIAYAPYPILIAIILFLFANGDKVEKWSAMLARFGSFISARMERASVARDIQGRINEIRSTPEFKELLPYGLRIKWEKGDTVSGLKEGEVLVVMSESRNQARNFLNGLMAYLAAGFLDRVRPYISPTVTRGAELLTASKIMAKERLDALPLFQREIVTPEFAKDPELAALAHTMETYDDVGLFTRVFLRELTSYGARLSGNPPRASDQGPVQRLMEMLTLLVTKPPGLDIESEFVVKTPNLDLCVVLVAKPYTLAVAGTIAHVNYVQRQAALGVAHFYVLARGENARYGKEVVQKLADSKAYQKDYEESFITSRIKTTNYIALLHILKPVQQPS